jgi:amino acid adenylation domain-containing protein/non-ribosomal peptide synthase protein (TIGR01720 family)
VVKAGRAGLKLRAADVFEHQTLGALAVAARKVNGAETEVATTEFGVDRLPVEVRARLKLAVGSLVDAWPAGPMQAGMLFQHVLVPESPAYCEQVVVTLRGALDATAFCEAWKSVLARHTNLRAVFAWEGLEEPWQAIPENIVVECLVLDWRGEESGPRLESWLAEDRARGFDLERGPLMRHALVRVAADGWLWIWTHHHILLDGWSLPVIFGELRALLSGLAIETLPMPRPYRDYLAWVRAQPRATAENYWRAMLRDWDEPTALPLVRSQAEARAQVGGDRDGMMLELSETETDALVQTARREQVTLNTLVQAAWARLLDAHAGGRGDVVFGVTVSGRPDELVDAAEMAGLFINTLPLRVQFDERALFGEWLRGLQRRQAELTRWAHCRLVDVRSWSVLAPEAPLFQTLLVFENYPSDARVLEPLGALRVEAFRFIERTELPLCVGVIPGQRLRFEFGYDPSLWRRDQMETLAARLRELLAGMVEAGGRRVADWWTSISPEGMAVTYPVFSDAEPGDATAVELLPARFARQVLERPKAVALTGAVGNWSYAELDAAADRIAIKLRDHGVGAEMVVALCLPRSAELIAAMLGVWKVGGAWLPLDPKQPVARLAAMAADAGVRVIVAKQPLDWIDASMTCVVVEARREKSESRTLYPDGEYGVARYDSVPELRAASLAYVIFTSGSTGRPKGVAVTQGGAAHLVRGKLALVPLGPGDRALQFANPVFDACITEIFVPLCAGATVVVPPAAGLLPGAELTDFMRVHDVTFAVLTASVLAATEAGPWPRRVLFAAGEACGPEIVSAWRAPGRTIWNAYGPTEISVCATMHCDDGTAEFPIGRALPGTTVHVLDARLRPVPAGAAGEIFVGGGGVARGYLGRADLTAERFVPDPFSTTLGSRLYRTGDLGRRRADGGLDYLGRADQQVKLRGFRIETGEIESALREQPSVRDACVVVREDERGRRQLVAYLVSGDIDAAALRAVLAKRLPDYMLPAAFVVLERIPLTASGKVNRAALPALEIAEVDATADDLATPVERVLAEVWQRVLRRGAVKRQDNFFALGGDSILSLQLVGEARRRGIVFTARQLFEQPTIARLAPVCVAAAGGAAARLAAGEKFGLTPIQRWFFSLELADTHHWNQALVFTVKVRRPVLVWQTALKTLQTAHPALRLRFTRGADGEWSQHYAAEDTAMRFEVCDGASLDEAAARSLVVTRAGELQTSFDLARGPVWGAVLFDFGPTRPGKLVVAVHHLAIDGVSWRILVDDLGLVLDDDESRVASEVVTFDAWGPALELWVNSGSAQREMAYWREMVSASVQTLPLDFPSAGGNQNLGATVEVVRTGFGAAETEALLRGTPRALGASVEELLLTALARTVTTWAGGAVLAHLEGHGREEFEGAPDVSRTVGWFTALYPAVLTDARGQEASETLRDVKAARRALPQRGLGYGVLRWFGDAAARNALVPRVAPEMTFNYLGQAGASAEDAPLVLTNDDAGPTQSPRARRSHLLDVTAIVMEGQLRVDWIFSGAHHRRTTIEGLAANFFTELREVLALTDAPRDVAPQAEDFPGLNLGERELAAVWEELKNDDDR